MSLACNCPPAGQDRKGPKGPHYRRSHPEMVEDDPDERAKDSVIYSLRSLPSCQSDLLLPIDFSNTVLAQREMSIYR